MEGSMFSPKGTENALEFLDSSCVGESLREYINIRYPYRERDNGCLNPLKRSHPTHIQHHVQGTYASV